MSDRLEAVVRGEVQGVGFRWFVRHHATRLKLRGWVANHADGSVRVVAEGTPAAVQRLAALLHDGPPGSEVSHVDARYSVATGGLEGFDVRAGGHAGD